MTDTAKIIADARKISELVVSQSEALTAYVTAAHAAADAILLLADEIEAEAGGDASGLPELNIHDAEPVQAGEVARFGVAISGTIEHEAARVTWTASNGETERLAAVTWGSRGRHRRSDQRQPWRRDVDRHPV